MKKIILKSLIVSLALGSLASVALAKDLPELKRPEPGNVRGTNATSTDKMGKKEMYEHIPDRVNLEKMNARFRATIDREESIMRRIVSRIEKIKDNGGKTAEAEKLVDQARGSLAKAKISLNSLETSEAGLNADVGASASTTQSKLRLANLRKITKEIEKNLNNTHKYLQKTTGLLRGISQLKHEEKAKKESGQASTTNQ